MGWREALAVTVMHLVSSYSSAEKHRSRKNCGGKSVLLDGYFLIEWYRMILFDKK